MKVDINELMIRGYVAAEDRLDRAIEHVATKIKEEKGATAVEYALLTGVIVIGVISAFAFLLPKDEGDEGNMFTQTFKMIIQKVQDFVQ
ncbi:MAG: hypothetical protein CSA22_02505 [Deltaproteobacteria bacterium]|nr:MAG: hypothetical protein CSA22_02505 [Deltaproteobacteria bacterium]